jgi:hypothetical protein
MTKPKTISIKPSWFDTRKYQDKYKLKPFHWYWELSIRKSYLEILNSNRNGLDNYKPFHRLRKNAFATLGPDPIIPESQLKSFLKKDIWSERNYKSHSARLSTCMDIFKLEIREDISEECQASTSDDEFGFIYEIPVEDSELMYNTPIDLQHNLEDLEGISQVREAHLTINLASPNSVLKEDIWKIIEALKNEYGNNPEIIHSNKRDWAESNVLEHIDLYLAEVQTGEEFKPAERVKWMQRNSNSKDETKASKNEQKEALKLLDDQILHQLYIEIYSAENKADLDRK